MKPDQLPFVDNIKWYVYKTINGSRHAQPICPEHNMRLQPVHDRQVKTPTGRWRINLESEARTLLCTDGNHTFKIPRNLNDEQMHVINKIDAQKFGEMSVINLDDIAIPVAKKELKDSDYWVRAKVTKSKTGDRLIVWAGSRSKKTKTQIFVEPELKRMSFDHNDDHPTEVFTKVEATFAGKVKSSIKKAS